MARGDSPIVRRVTRILNEPARPAWRPSPFWLAPPLAVVAMAAPLVTAAELSHRPPDWPRLAWTLEMATNSSTAGEQKQQDEPSAPRVWSASELAQARARLRVHRAPRPSDPLADRWRWALDDARRQGIGDFWIVYRFDTPTHAQDLMMSDTREGTIVSTSGRLIAQGPPLADLLDDAGGSGNVTVLIHYGSAQSRCDRPRRLSQHATRVRLWTHAGVLAGRRTRGPELRTRPGTVRAGKKRENSGTADRVGVAPSDHRPGAAVPDAVGRSGKPVAIRREAAEGFNHHHDPRSVEILMRVAGTDTVSEVRAEAAETIGEVQTPQSIPALTDLATNAADRAVRREAAEAFGDQPPALALPAIEALIATSDDDEVLVEAIEALAEIEDPRVLAAPRSNRDRASESDSTAGGGRDAGRCRVARRCRRIGSHRLGAQGRENPTRGRRDSRGPPRCSRRCGARANRYETTPVEEVQAEAIETLADVPDHQLGCADSRAGHHRQERAASPGGSRRQSPTSPRTPATRRRSTRHSRRSSAPSSTTPIGACGWRRSTR